MNKKDKTSFSGKDNNYGGSYEKTKSLRDFKDNIIEREVNYLLAEIFEELVENTHKLSILLFKMLGDSVKDRPDIKDKISRISGGSIEIFEDPEIIPFIEAFIFDYSGLEGQTIFERYFYREKSRFLKFVQNTFAYWIKSYFSIYEIIGLNDDGHTFLAEDIFTQKKYTIHKRNINPGDIRIGDLIITRILCKGDIFEVLGFSSLPNLLKTEIIERVKRTKKEKELKLGRKMEWHEFLKKYGYLLLVMTTEYLNIIASEELDEISFMEFKDKFDWESEKYKIVAEQLKERLKDEYTLEQIYVAILIWNSYCKLARPRFSKIETVVATLEYVISLTAGKEVTQKEIAFKYGVSVSSISSRYTDIIETFRKHGAYDLYEQEDFENHF